MAFELHEIRKTSINARPYCGPAALMAFSGKDFEEVRALINKVRGREHNKPVRGLSNHHLRGVIGKLGYSTDTMIPAHRFTVHDFAETVKPDEFWFVIAGHHYVVMCEGLVADNRIRFGCEVAKHPWRRRIVKEAIRVIHPEESLARFAA